MYKMLVPLDGSEVALCVIPQVKAITDGWKTCEVILLHVVETPPTWVMENKGMRESHAAEEKKSKEYLSEIQSQIIAKGMTVTTEVLVGNAAETIINYTKEKQVDFLVMTTHVSSALSQLVFGSVSNKVMRCSGVPVLMVTPSTVKCK